MPVNKTQGKTILSYLEHGEGAAGRIWVITHHPRKIVIKRLDQLEITPR